MSFFDSTLWTILQLPILEIIVVGVLAGLVGVLAVLHQRVFFVESVAHGTFPGAILGVVLGKGLASGWDLDNDTQHSVLSLFLFAGALLACVPLSWLMHRLTRIAGQSSQASAGIVLTLGFALGYFLSKWFQPLPLKIESFLTGSVLSVNRTDVLAAGVVLIITIVVLVTFGRQLIFYAFDGGGYRAAGHSATIAEGVILGLICAAIVVVIPAVGTILSIALVAAPAAGLQPLVRSTRGLFIAAPVAGVAIGAVGLAFAVKADLSAGGMIALTAGVFYVGCLVVGKLLARRG